MTSKDLAIAATALMLTLQGCDNHSSSVNEKGGNGADTFVPDVEAARARSPSEIKPKPKASQRLDPKKQGPTDSK